MNGLTQLMLWPLLRKRCILYIESSAIANQAALEKNLSLLKVLLFLSL